VFARWLSLLSAIALLAGCVGTGGAARVGPGDPRVGALAGEIEALGGPVAPGEARLAAHSLVVHSEQLRTDYRMVQPALFHNMLVNLGLRERGLCCHFAEDLIAGLVALELRTLDVHWVVARHGSRLREHSSVLLVPSGGAFEQGLVVDAWREAGKLFWAPVADDRYPWQLHPMSGSWARLHCR
jgi:hypothetical protein